MKQFNDLNRLIYIVNEYSTLEQKSYPKFSIKYLFNLTPIGGVNTDFEELFNLADNLGLIILDGENIKLTHLGVEFHHKNPTQIYELNIDQKSFIYEIYLKIKRQEVSILFSQFEFQDEFLIYKKEIPAKLRTIFEQLFFLDVINKNSPESYIITKEYWSKIISKPKTEKDLIKSLKYKKTIGEKAEFIALFYEFSRLRNKNIKKVYKKIIYHSKDVVNLGYDIKSMNCDNVNFLKEDNLIFNRFIEVKNTSNNIFYMTKHELEVAKNYEEYYWLYLVKIGKSYIQITFIQDPIKFFRENNIKLEPFQFIISTVNFPSNLETERINI